MGAKNRIADEVKAKGASHVSRVLDVPRGSLLSYLAGSAREGTSTLIEQRAVRLDESTTGDKPAA